MNAVTLPIREATKAAHQQTLERYRSPGDWWTASERTAIVREVRQAVDCALCADRRNAVSPTMVTGEHDHGGELPSAAVEVIHAVRNDSGRLTRRWFDQIVPEQLSMEAYVELISLIASSVIVDTYAQGVGGALVEVAEPLFGEPTRGREPGVEDAGAWVPVAAEGRANILRALGSVPNANSLFFGAFSPSYYMPTAEFDLSRSQVELVAARVSAVNQCFY